MGIITTTQPAAITGLVSENLTPTTADLKAQINPNGLETRYRFEYVTVWGRYTPPTLW